MTVLGPSGSGKTTILRVIGGLVRPTRGAVLLDGADISAMPINRRPFNTVFQDYALFPHMTVEGNVGYGLKVRGERKATIRRRVAETLRLVALEEFATRYPAQLSGGQQQRVALARAIICEPRLILLDEPLGALDAELRRQMQRFLKRLQKEIRTTFLFVTHDQEEAVTIADRICVMNHGRIEQVGSPEEVYYRPANEYVARFFGDNNLIDVGFGSLGDGGRQLSPRRSAPFAARSKDRPGLAEAPAGRTGKLLVRPEAIAVGDAADGAQNRVRVRVEEMSFVGPVSQVRGTPAGRARTGADGQAAEPCRRHPACRRPRDRGRLERRGMPRGDRVMSAGRRSDGEDERLARLSFRHDGARLCAAVHLHPVAADPLPHPELLLCGPRQHRSRADAPELRALLHRAAFVPVFFSTCALCLGVAAITVIFGYPVAYLLASLQGRRKYVMMVIFVVPLMMSYIIKIYAIRAILGGNGFLNRILLFLGLIDQPLTFLIFNLKAVLLTLSAILSCPSPSCRSSSPSNASRAR